MTLGRPSKYTDKLADEICKMISTGMSVESVCGLPDMPCIDTFYRWVEKHTHLSESYARANKLRADIYANQVVQIADDPAMGERKKIKSDGTEEITTGDNVERSKLRCEARKWLAGKLSPGKYGDSQMLKLSGQIDHTVRHEVGSDERELIKAVAQQVAASRVCLPEQDIEDAEFTEESND